MEAIIQVLEKISSAGMKSKQNLEPVVSLWHTSYKNNEKWRMFTHVFLSIPQSTIFHEIFPFFTPTVRFLLCLGG